MLWQLAEIFFFRLFLFKCIKIFVYQVTNTFLMVLVNCKKVCGIFTVFYVCRLWHHCASFRRGPCVLYCVLSCGHPPHPAAAVQPHSCPPALGNTHPYSQPSSLLGTVSQPCCIAALQRSGLLHGHTVLSSACWCPLLAGERLELPGVAVFLFCLT